MAEKIKISDLFDFSDVQDLQELYRRLEQINQIYKELAKNISQESQTINKGIEANVKEVKKLSDALKVAGDSADIKKLSDAIEKQAEVNKKLTAQNEKLTAQNDKLKQSQKEVNEEGKEAERLLKEQARLKAKISAATGEEAKQNAILKLKLAEVNKETKKQAKEASGLESAYDKLRRETAEAKREALELGAAFGKNSKQFKDASKRAKELNDNLGDLNADVGNFQGNVGNYASALDGINGNLSNLVGLAGPAGIALAAVTIGVETIGALAETVQETNNQLKETALLTGLNGDQLTDYTSKVRATAKVFDQDYKEVLKATNAITKEFGITGDEALDLINSGFVQGANINDDYLDQLREYSTQFKAAGLEAENLIQITALGAREGIFNDKAVDVVKEGGLRLREFTKATKDALIPLGKLRNEQIQQAIASGNSFEAIQLVSKGLKEVNLTAQQSQTIITDVFGGPGEDAGQRFIELLSTVDTSQKNILANLTEQQKQQLRVLEVEQDLANAEVRLGEAFKNSSKEISIFFTELQTLGIEFIIDAVNEAKEGIEELTPVFNEVSTEVKRLFDFFDLGESSLLKFIKNFNPITNEIEKATRFVKGFLNVLNFLLSLLNDFISVLSIVADEIITFARSFDVVDTAIEKVTGLYGSLNDTFKDSPKILNGVSAAFVEFFNQIQSKFKNFLLNIKDGITGFLTADVKLIAKAVNSQVNDIKGAGTKIAEAFEKGYNEGPKIEDTVKKDIDKTSKVLDKNRKDQEAKTKEQGQKEKAINDKALQDKLKQIEDAAAKEKLAKTKERQQELIDEEDFQFELFRIRVNALKQKIDLLKAEGKDTTALEQQLADDLLNEGKKNAKRFEDQEKERLKAKDLADKKAAKKDEKARKKREQDEKDEDEKRKERFEKADPLIEGLKERQFAEAELLEKQAQNAKTEEERNAILAKAAKEREKAQLKALFIDTVASELKEGKTPSEAIGTATQTALLTKAGSIVAQGFHDGGYTGDGNEWAAAGVVHKGEHVITKKQTDKYGLKGLSANDFDSAIETGYFNQFAKTNTELADQMNYKQQITVNNDNTNVVDAINNLPNKMPTEKLKGIAGYLQHEQKINGIKTRTTFKNTGRTCA